VFLQLQREEKNKERLITTVKREKDVNLTVTLTAAVLETPSQQR